MNHDNTPPKQKVVLASGNSGKLRELQHRLEGLPYTLVTQSALDIPSPEETGLTFIENAILKARHAAQMSQLPAIADDSGLAVRVLNGEPGIYSARFSGDQATSESNNQLLLEKLKDFPESASQASFHCAIVYLSHAEDPTPIICEGVWNGFITKSPKGGNGFGYDPLFWIPDHGCTAAELSPDIKNNVSHRGQALTQLIEKLSSSYSSRKTD